MNAPASERGFILLSVVVAITLLAAITFVLAYQGASQTGITVGELERDKLRYVAEAGMAHAKVQLAKKTSCSGYTDIPSTGFAGENYSATFSQTANSPVTINATGVLAGGAKLSLQSNEVRVYQPPEAVTVQLGKDAGKDVQIDSFYPNANYGGNDDLTVRSASSWIQRVLLEFDLTKIPPGAKIISAYLDLEQRIVGTPGVIGVHRVTRSWEEGTGKGTGNADGATWNEYDGASGWAQPGGDIASTLYAATAVSSAKNGGRVAWDIRDLVQEWVSAESPNYGLMLVGDGVVDNAEFESREETDPAAAPKLTIVYACECGKVCDAAPVAGKNILLVVGDTANLTGEQADKKALMEGWGHAVSLIATDDTQAAFDTAAALVDVVYVPELGAGPMGELGAKADNLAQGVITEEARKPLMLGSFSLSPFVNADTINITDNTHYITETLPTGNVLLSTAVQSMWVLKGTLAVDLHVLGQLDGTQPGLAYLEKGELRNDSSPAPARRVKLPWGSYNFDVNLLTDDGLEIMQRAIEWGATTAGSGGPYNVLFVVGSVGGAGPTAEEIAHQALIESWGHTVELIDDDATQAEFDTAVANNDVAFTTNDITASRLNTKLVNATIGVVTSEDNLSDEFGMASTIGWESGSVVEINDNTHYITSPFPTGLLTILSTSESLAYVTGTLSTDLGQLASSTSGYGIVTLETGASMYGGGSAAGRRAQLPWGGNGFDPNNLTADGLTILQRAIEWGAEVYSLPGPTAHWKLDDGTGLTAIDSVGGHDGTLVNGPIWVAGQIGDALHFDGANDYVDAGTFDVSGSGLTLMAWFNADTIPTSDGRFISKAAGPDEFEAWWQLSTTDVGADRYLRMRIKAGGTTTTFRDSSVKLTTGQWYFAVATYDNSGAMKLYLDGVEVASTAHAVGGPVDADPSVPVAIGANGTVERFFHGVLDDVRIYDRALNATEIADLYADGGGGGGGGGGGCNGTFRDEFNSRAFSGSDGTLTWAGNWLEVGESNGPTSGDIQVLSNLSNNRLRTRDNDNGGEGVEREADLTDAATATLTYDYRRMNLDSASDYTSVEISANGASGPWTELTRHQGSGNDSSYQPASHDITAYKSTNTRIRFITSSSMGNTDTVWFDNVEIACTP